MIKITDSKIELTVRRPEGNIETVDVSAKFRGCWNKQLFAQIQAATAKAGKGEVLSYTETEAVWEKEEKDYFEHCERCGQMVDTRVAYHQMERGWFGGREVKVKAYYCKDCYQVLSAVGAGERTALEDRATEAPDNTPETKSDF